MLPFSGHFLFKLELANTGEQAQCLIGHLYIHPQKKHNICKCGAVLHVEKKSLWHIDIHIFFMIDKINKGKNTLFFLLQLWRSCPKLLLGYWNFLVSADVHQCSAALSVLLVVFFFFFSLVREWECFPLVVRHAHYNPIPVVFAVLL